MWIEEIAPAAWRLSFWPMDALNAYVLGDILVDSGLRFGHRRLLDALSPMTIRAHALTHAHFDHQGGSHAACERFGIPLWCGEGDRAAVESGDLTRITPHPDSLLVRFMQRYAGPGHPVARVLRDGDACGDFVVVEAPGHTPGHLAFWRARDRILILGDVLFHRDPITLRHRLREPFTFATFDPRLNRDSARRLAALEPALVCFGHGEPLRDRQSFAAFVRSLADG
jgi:hydroxyacylglutathione hydrolase